ncbi:unnamed protein product [Penicillium camemberti]|uniref:Str. FM013 n=1 Tax=Penicillium camemberti (strain FM 013) TaxID=1429867 RepID=A0A0G4PQS4_PENC3|nr:unnamed protein product [Penicillium camemberti]
MNFEPHLVTFGVLTTAPPLPAPLPGVCVYYLNYIYPCTYM